VYSFLEFFFGSLGHVRSLMYPLCRYICLPEEVYCQATECGSSCDPSDFFFVTLAIRLTHSRDGQMACEIPYSGHNLFSLIDPRESPYSEEYLYTGSAT
jgi:hypothetical protein